MELTHRHAHRSICLTSAFFLTYFTTSLAAIAQIVPDKTLPNNSTVTTTGQLHTINGGTTVGVNLYHSFQDFSVPTNNTAYFNNAPQVQNILTRVTGSSASDIDGTIRANGNANLYLLNPNGITFGQNAKLEIGGSFTGSTGSSFKFPDGSEFSAKNPQAPPLLTMSITPGLQYGTSDTGATISSSGKLTVPQDLTLVADKLDLQGQLQAGGNITLKAQDTVKIRDTTTSPFVAISGGNLLVQGNNSVDISILNHPNSGFWSAGDMVLRSQNPILGDAHFFAGSNFSVENLNGTSGKLLSPNDPVILASGDVTLGDYTGASLHILAGGSVTLGNITIDSVGTQSTTINPNNTTLFNATRTYADLATFNLTDYKAIYNSDGSFNSVVPAQTSITIDGSNQATLDVRAGVDWSQLGGLPTTPILDTVAPSVVTYSSTSGRADITINGDIRVSQPSGLVLLTNQFSPNTLSGKISVKGIDTSTTVDGKNGGDIRIYATGDISLHKSYLYSSSFSTYGNSGNGGAISLSANTGDISLNDSDLDSSSKSVTSSWNSGNGGAISLSANTGNISLLNSQLSSPSFFLSSSSPGYVNSGNGGAISLSANTGNISLLNSQLFSASFSNYGNPGNGGAISLSANTGNISLLNSQLFSEAVFNGLGSGLGANGGAISLSTNTGNISLNSSSLYTYSDSDNSRNGGAISLSTNTGNISLLNSSSLYSFSYSTSGKSGDGGDIFLSAINGNILGTGLSSIGSFSIANTPNSTSGAGGNVTLDAKNLISNTEILTQSSSGTSGSVKISGLGDLAITDLQIITSKTVSIPDPLNLGKTITFEVGKSGRSGNVTVAGLGSLTFDNTIINSITQGSDPAGNVLITSPGTITFQNNSQILSSTNNSGLAGSVTINAAKAISILDKSELNAQTTATGKAGNITINTPLLNLAGTAKITTNATATSTNANGGGNITLNATTMNLFGTVGIFSDTQGVSPAGTLTLAPFSNQPNLNIAFANNSAISASTSASGNGGNITLTAPQAINLTGNGKIAVETSGSGNAGDIKIYPGYSLLIDGVSITSSALSGATGNPGSILIDPQFVTLQNGASISTSNAGTGNGLGNINITSNFLSLLNSSFIKADATSQQAGNITLNIPAILLLRNGSFISTTVGQQGITGIGGGGGNITINAGFIVGVKGENSDIFASAFNTGANGGIISITTNGIYGLDFRPNLTSFSDITTYSQFGLNGTVNINTPGLDPSRGLTNLPVNLADPSKQVSQSCAIGGKLANRDNRFTISGRGGLPKSPTDELSSIHPLVELADLVPSSISATEQKQEVTQQVPKRIVEANTLVRDSQGVLHLVAASNPLSPAIPQLSCP